MEEYNRKAHLPQQIENLLQVRLSNPDAFDYVLKGCELALKQKIDDADITKGAGLILDSFVKSTETALTQKDREDTVIGIREALAKLDDEYVALKHKYMEDVITLLMDEAEKTDENAG